MGIQATRGITGPNVLPLAAVQERALQHGFKVTGERRINELRAIVELRKVRVLPLGIERQQAADDYHRECI